MECTHLAWNADTRNTRGFSFYDRLGPKITEQQGNHQRWQVVSSRRQSVESILTRLG